MMNTKRFIFNVIDTNCYLLWDETKEAVLIDAGCQFPAEKEELKRFIEKEKLTLKHYLNTHLHFDHVMGNPFVEDVFGCKAEANDGDIAWLTNIKRKTALFGFRYEEEPRPLGTVLNDGDKVTFGENLTIECLHVPGHSRGSLAYYISAEKVLFSGDVLFRESVGRTDFPDGNAQALQDSIRKKLFVLPDETTVYPGHDVETSIGYEKLNNPYV